MSGWLVLYAVALGALARFRAGTRSFRGTGAEVARWTDAGAAPPATTTTVNGGRL